MWGVGDLVGRNFVYIAVGGELGCVDGKLGGSLVGGEFGCVDESPHPLQYYPPTFSSTQPNSPPTTILRMFILIDFNPNIRSIVVGGEFGCVDEKWGGSIVVGGEI